MMTLITGIVGIAMLVAFLGVLLWWIRAVPLMIVVASVILLLLYDFTRTLRQDERGVGR